MILNRSVVVTERRQHCSLYQSRNQPEGVVGESGISAAATALEILPRPQDKDALKALSVKMPEVPGIAGQQIASA